MKFVRTVVPAQNASSIFACVEAAHRPAIEADARAATMK